MEISTSLSIIGWIIAIFWLVFLVGAILGHSLAEHSCQEKCEEEGDKRYGAGVNTYLEIKKWFWVGHCKFFCMLRNR